MPSSDSDQSIHAAEIADTLANAPLHESGALRHETKWAMDDMMEQLVDIDDSWPFNQDDELGSDGVEGIEETSVKLVEPQAAPIPFGCFPPMADCIATAAFCLRPHTSTSGAPYAHKHDERLAFSFLS